MKTFATITVTTASLFVMAGNADAHNYSTPFYEDAPSRYSTPRTYTPSSNSYRTPVRPAGYTVPVRPAYGATQPAYRYPSYVQPVNNQLYPGNNCPNGQCGPCANGQCGPCANGQCGSCVNGRCGLPPKTGCVNGRCYTSGFTAPVQSLFPRPVYRPAVAPRYVPRTSYNTGGPVRVFRD